MTQLSLLSGMDTPAKSSENVQQTDGSPSCQCGKGMSGCSIHPNTRDKWIASMKDSLVKTLALPGIKRALDMRHDPAFIEKSSVLLASFDPVTCSLKTSQQSLVTDSEPYSQTLPRWGSLRNGDVSEHPIAAHGMSAKDGFFLPTLTVNGNYNRKGSSNTSGDGLVTALKKMPTLCSRDWKDTGTSNAERNRHTPPLAVHAGGPLNPNWCEWYMGFPVGFTELKDSATPKSRYKPQLPGNSLEANK
jgi:hypothetical protein